MMLLEPFSFGVGDRFAHQAPAQLRAFQRLAQTGVQVAPAWNKSHREHTTIGSAPPRFWPPRKTPPANSRSVGKGRRMNWPTFSNNLLGTL